jgi:hypothetical protein
MSMVMGSRRSVFPSGGMGKGHYDATLLCWARPPLTDGRFPELSQDEAHLPRVSSSRQRLTVL